MFADNGFVMIIVRSVALEKRGTSFANKGGAHDPGRMKKPLAGTNP